MSQPGTTSTEVKPKEKKYFLVTGSRTWSDFHAIESQLENMSPDEWILVQGGASGADRIANHIWKKMEGESITCKADWDKYGKAAGPKRNEEMLKDHPISKAFAFCINASAGTMHMISLLNKNKIPVTVTMI